MMGDAADDLAHFEYRQANPLVWHDEEDEVADKPKIERPPLEEWRLSAWPLSKTSTVIDYALSLEAELARHKRYRERTKDFTSGCEYCGEQTFPGLAEIIAKEEGIE